MSILVDRDTRVVVQGITGKTGLFHADHSLQYGTQIVAGVTPGKGGVTVLDNVPVFDTVLQARRETGADASLIFVPPPFAADAILEAAEAGVGVIVAITEGIPALDMLKVKNALEGTGAVLIGPNCPGIITPEQARLGIMPGSIFSPGRVGVISRSGTLTYEAVDQLSRLGIGQSTCVGIGGDPIVGSSFVDILARFKDDPDTDAVVLIGEIGGTAEEEAAEYVRDELGKPAVAFIAGQTAPPGKRMGHAGAIISGGKGTAADKITALEACGVAVAPTPADIGATLQAALAR
jgi:succinyl-CoA synthetase alpha subunit